MRTRYEVTSLTGYPIGAHGGQSHTQPESTEFYVLDRLVNHRIVERFSGDDAAVRATLRCEALNEQHEAALT
jgi:hypothetical protein